MCVGAGDAFGAGTMSIIKKFGVIDDNSIKLALYRGNFWAAYFCERNIDEIEYPTYREIRNSSHKYPFRPEIKMVYREEYRLKLGFVDKIHFINENTY